MTCTAPYTISICAPTHSALYRLLRTIERDGWLQSRWTTSTACPRRRVYELTSAGRNNIAQLANVITTLRDSHAVLLDVYEHEPRSPRPSHRDDAATSPEA